MSIEAPAPSGRPLAQLSYQIVSEALGCRSGLWITSWEQATAKKTDKRAITPRLKTARGRWQQQPGTPRAREKFPWPGRKAGPSREEVSRMQA